MVKRWVRVYIEGGAEGRIADNEFRQNWKKFLSELHETARNTGNYHKLDVIRLKGRSNAFDRFKKAKIEFPDDLCVLLVDSETVVLPLNKSVWDVVKQRKEDNWDRPDWATEKHLYLMVPFLETWLLTDPEALGRFFKRGFESKDLPTNNLESRSKDDIDAALKKATRNSKVKYRHGLGNIIIGDVHPDNVKTLHHGKRLFDCLSELITGIVDPQTNC
jgi:hypothetical protein